jgi:hypothetical protein
MVSGASFNSSLVSKDKKNKDSENKVRKFTTKTFRIRDPEKFIPNPDPGYGSATLFQIIEI